jgi:propanol-preferring alcohol dehydrogenase
MPRPGRGEVLIAVEACGVCRTDLHVVDGELSMTRLPIVPGHEVVGRVVAIGDGVVGHLVGSRVGAPWLGKSCGNCAYCRSNRENLCDAPQFNGCTRDGGFASHMVADAEFVVRLNDIDDPVSLAPLLCAGLIGWRCLRKASEGPRIGLYGFGAAAHILCQICGHEAREVYAFTRPGDTKAQDFARSLGAVWAGGSDEAPPQVLHSAILFAPVGDLVPTALAHVGKGGRVVCGGIHMSDIPQFPYALLWGEREVVSVANLTRRDASEFFPAAAQAHVSTETHAYPLEAANDALNDLRTGKLTGAAVLVP